MAPAYSPALIPLIDQPFIYLSDALGASPDELKLMISFILSYPLTGLLKRIPDRNPWQKNAFVIGVSMFYLIGLFTAWGGLRTLFWSAAMTYGISYFIQGPFMPWIGFIVLMGHMSINHIHRQMVNDPGLVDITGAQMVLVMKLTAFCWNVHDGRLPESELSDFQKERQIKVLPDLLDFAGYVLFFPSLFAGPAFDYADYKNYITTSMFTLPPGTDPAKAPPTRKKRKIPRSGTPAMIRMICGMGWIFGYLQFSGYFYQSYFLSDDFLKYGIFRRIFQVHMLAITARMKYYGVWFLAEGACILSGIGYNGIDEKTGKAKWDRLVNVRPWEIEFGQNMRGYLAGWNVNTNAWLRNYVYLRVTPKGQKPGFTATLATFVTSAFWHGFYPGYYLAFVLASFTQTAAKHGRKLIRPFFLKADGKTPGPYKLYYDIFTCVITNLTITFIVIPFQFLTLPESIKVWSRVYYYGVVGTALCFGLLNTPAKGFAIKKLKARAAAERPGLERKESDLSIKEREEMQSTLGLPHDPEFEMQEFIREVKQEVETRRRRGSTVPDFKIVLQQKLDEFRRDQAKGRQTPISGGGGNGQKKEL